MKPAQLSTFVGSLSKQPGAEKRTGERHWQNHSRTVEKQSTVLYPPGCQRAGFDREELSDALAAFTDAAIKYAAPKFGASGGRAGGDEGGGDHDPY